LEHSGYGFEMLMAEYCRRSLCGVVKINLKEQEIETMNLEYCSIAWKNSTKKINILLQPDCNSEDSTKKLLNFGITLP
jgi:hypothetical protein